MQVLSAAGRPMTTDQLDEDGTGWIEHVRVPDLSCGTYFIPAGGTDVQEPHTEDELYVCTTGRARLVTPTASCPVSPGTVVFVAADEEHRFVDIEEDLTVFVVFGPAEYSRRPEGDAR
ncbi:cupin [Nocardioides agariphilus]|jgi:mannose-6-phosphate isomerase-like protein (cupin superfamily)|nr:cupin [Nocardioides agariphilus]